jgi:hypothetical protein
VPIEFIKTANGIAISRNTSNGTASGQSWQRLSILRQMESWSGGLANINGID